MTKQGVVIVNLGTPDQPKAKEVRAYLSRFLGDHRVIDKPRWMWLPILHGIILRTRPKKSALLYQEIWQEDGSPLLLYTKAQARHLQDKLPDRFVRYAMSYSDPLLSNVLEDMMQQGVTELVVIPLYPQYSVTTTATVFDQAARFFLKQTFIPSLHLVHAFYEHPLYISWISDQIKQKLNEQPIDMLIFSYHGIPVSYVQKGDCYPEHCEKTTALIMEQVGDIPYRLTYQSKFGPDEWLTPATDETMKHLPEEGIKHVLVITPGFVADCLETIEEIEGENRSYFLSHGGDSFTYVNPFNDNPILADILKELVETYG